MASVHAMRTPSMTRARTLLPKGSTLYGMAVKEVAEAKASLFIPGLN